MSYREIGVIGSCRGQDPGVSGDWVGIPIRLGCALEVWRVASIDENSHCSQSISEFEAARCGILLHPRPALSCGAGPSP